MEPACHLLLSGIISRFASTCIDPTKTTLLRQLGLTKALPILQDCAFSMATSKVRGKIKITGCSVHLKIGHITSAAALPSLFGTGEATA